MDNKDILAYFTSQNSDDRLNQLSTEQSRVVELMKVLFTGLYLLLMLGFVFFGLIKDINASVNVIIFGKYFIAFTVDKLLLLILSITIGLFIRLIETWYISHLEKQYNLKRLELTYGTVIGLNKK